MEWLEAYHIRARSKHSKCASRLAYDCVRTHNTMPLDFLFYPEYDCSKL